MILAFVHSYVEVTQLLCDFWDHLAGSQRRKMQFTPESNFYPARVKEQHCYDDCFDSGYSGLFHSPQSTSGVDFCRPLSPVELSETPKENLVPPAMLKRRTRELDKSVDKDSRTKRQPSAVSWCETPKGYKSVGSLRHRLLKCKLNTDIKTLSTRSPCSKETESSIITGSSRWLSTSLDSLDSVTETMALSTINPEQDLPFSGRKRLPFSQMRTSTLVEGETRSGQPADLEGIVSDADFSKIISACDQTHHVEIQKSQSASSKESSRSPDSSVSDDLNDIFCTPSSTQTPRYISLVCEDSGFSSLALDKSQDSSMDHDGSFQELLLSATRKKCETPNLTEAKRRSRLQRQHRLSTLKEGNSQSEEDPADRKNEHLHLCNNSSNNVFTDDVTPRRPASIKCDNMASDSFASVKPENATALVATPAKPENTTPSGSAANPDVTPHTTNPVDLSLTPALQLVHAMCQQKAQMFAGQSPTLKKQLKSTAALAETSVMLRTTMPLAGLIGRKMGVGKVDIFTELKRRSLRHILAVILGHLSPETIYRCGQVCKSWNEIILQDKRAAFWRSHFTEVTSSLELNGSVHLPDVETRVTILKRSALKTVQMQSRTSSFCTPQSGYNTSVQREHSVEQSGSSKREKFLKVAKTLFSDECLKPCPRCQHPARCHSVKGEGVCSRDDCGFKFCTSCLCTYHGSKECGSQSAGRRKKDILLPGSAQSRRNIRRL